jgi:AraC-like DNA-binding protein
MADSGNNMTISIKQKKRKTPKQTPRPILVYGNWFQFRAGERLTRSRAVESRMLLSVHRGSGVFRINGKDYPAGTGSWFFLPWAHAIEYAADAADPFLVGGLHVIPDHDHGYPVRNQVAHEKGDRLAGVRYRRDADLLCGTHLLEGSFAPRHCRLRALVVYLIESFDPQRPDEAKQRQSAEWLLEEIGIALEDKPPLGPKPRPEVLARVEAHVRQNLHKPLNVPGLARVGKCSVAGIHRLFRHWHDETPAKWIAGERIEQAAYLLRTTRSPVKNIAEDVGIPDQFQFSRFFKRHAGCSPREYRKRQGIL